MDRQSPELLRLAARGPLQQHVHMREKQDRHVPVVSRVVGDTLVELIYKKEKGQTALAVSRFNGLWNIEAELKVASGDILVPYSATNNLIVNGCVLLPSSPVEYGLKGELIGDIRSYLRRHVDLSADFERIAAYYVLLSWVYDAFSEVPYLRFLGEWGTGKSRALTTIGSICYKPFFASGASTTSPIFHIQDTFGGTLVLDEADMSHSDAKSDLVKILNNGTSKGMPVLRSIVNRYRELNPYAFKVFGPKLLASRQRFEDDALESRFITERMGTTPIRKEVPVAMPPSMEAEALELRNRLLHFRLCEFLKITSGSAGMPESWDPRLKQMAGPLLSLVEDDDDRKAVEAGLLIRFEQARSERAATPEACVLAAAHSIVLDEPEADIPVGRIARQYNEAYAEYEPRSSRWIGSVLRNRFGLKTRKTRGVYVVPASEQPKLLLIATRNGLSLD